MADSSASQSLDELLFSVIDGNTSISWDEANRRFSGLLIRAIYNVVRCDELLKSIQPSCMKPSDHEILVAYLRDRTTSSETELENNPEWKLWTISCLISDAQHRIAATFDRCIANWLLHFDPDLVEEERSLRIATEGALTVWVGTKIFALRAILTVLAHGHKSGKGTFRAHDSEALDQFNAAIELMKHIRKAIELVDTNAAARALLRAHRSFRASMKKTDQSNEPMSSCELLDRLHGKKQSILTDEECLTIVLGRVNDFKHRATGAKWEAQFAGKLYMRHIELAVTTQALRVVIRFFKLMASLTRDATAIAEDIGSRGQKGEESPPDALKRA
ncbi:MAG TPA: hypothetical protein VII56_13160 [Rhizomicrobium sp.]